MSPSEPLDALSPVIVHHIVNSLGWNDLRPLQRDAAGPLLAGEDALLLAPTAGGKTEAAIFPILSRMTEQRWPGPSVLYLCPLKALLNNLLPRLRTYADWVGRRVNIWHGDVTTASRRTIISNRPDIILTTPESLEAMLVSANVDHRAFLANLQVVIVDEVHAFGGDDRGWHLLALLERLTRVASGRLQRIGLSATVGNPSELLRWLQGSAAGTRPAKVIAPEISKGQPPPGAVEIDYVGSLENAATVIASLHAGEKRLVFCESRQAVEELGQLLRAKDITTFLSHASLSIDERRRAEQAFSEARDCVIVSTNTLELGIDVGDLDRVIQIDAPTTVSSFLQRIGRTGRRPGTSRNCLFLTTRGSALLEAAALTVLWQDGWVEAIAPPPEPRHIVAQQILALCLQEGRIGDRTWRDAWNGLEPFGVSADVIVRYLAEQGFVDNDGGMLFIGPEAEKRFGHRHFMDMTAVFTGPPEFTALHGRTELGRIDPSLLIEEVRGARRILLGGRSWTITYIDWRRRRCFVEPADSGGKARWLASGWGGLGNEICQAIRRVLLGADPPVKLTRRALDRLAHEREEHLRLVHPGGTLVVRDAGGDLRWWTWAGFRANATLVTTLSQFTDPAQRFDDFHIRLRENVTPAEWTAARKTASEGLCLPEPNPKAISGLKFSAALPERLAIATLAARLADLPSAERTLSEASRFVSST